MARARRNQGWQVHNTLMMFTLTLAMAAIQIQSAPAQSVPAQSAPAQTSGQTQSQPPATTQSQDIPDAPSTVQPPAPKPVLPQPTPTDVARPPQPSQTPASDSTQPSDSGKPAPPPMPPVQTIPAGTGPRNQIDPSQDLYKISVVTNFVQIPVMVKDSEGRRVDGLRPTDFTVLENGKKQTLTFFSSDPFQLSVAVLIDTGLPDVAVQKINETYSALLGAFSPYDEIAVYTYSSTVSQASDFTTRNDRLTAVMNQLKLVRGANNGPAVLNGPFATGPVVNGAPISGPAGVSPVNTPPRESHVLNDAILRATLDLSKRGRDHRKVIFIISDGRELGSQASYRQVLRVLQTHDIEVKAVVVDTSALPGFRQAEKIHHLFLQGYSDILPKYTHATGGGDPYMEISRNAIEDAYASITSDTRNQYTLGYSPKATTGNSAYRSIEVQVDKKVKVTAKDGYYPAAR